ncbi:MAG: DnaJ domain-containing protein [Alphaproteobacteria bacterium]
MAPSLRDRYLTILELAPGQTYTDQDIKAAWRKMAFKTHPDRGGSAAAFNEAFSAYKALK